VLPMGLTKFAKKDKDNADRERENGVVDENDEEKENRQQPLKGGANQDNQNAEARSPKSPKDDGSSDKKDKAKVKSLHSSLHAFLRLHTNSLGKNRLTAKGDIPHSDFTVLIFKRTSLFFQLYWSDAYCFQ